MATTYDAALSELYRARLDVFVAERKRLAAALKAAGDKAGAARFAKLGRPPISAWAVNQLWWEARPAFEELLRAAARARFGDRAAMVAHRELLAKLRAGASAVLGDAGHAATEATLRRVTATLAAIAATGSFDPDPPGALTTDRAPPGFDAVALTPALTSPSPLTTSPGGAAAPSAERAGVAREDMAQVVVLAEAVAARQAEQERAAAERVAAERAAAERAAAERAAAERARRLAERERLEGELRSTKREAEAHTRELDRLRQELAAAETKLKRTQATLEELEARRAELDSEG